MRFALTDDQVLFRDAVRDFLSKECPPEVVRAAWADGTGRSDQLWAALAGLGVVGLTVPEAHGGLGMDELDLVPLLQEAGRAALPEPLLETTGVVAPLLASVEADGEASSAARELAAVWLGRIAAGDARASIGLDGSPLVADAHVAGIVVLQRGDELIAAEPSTLTIAPQQSVDGARRLFTVEVDTAGAVVLAAAERARELVDASFDRAALGSAALLVGLADQMLAMTVAYVVEREQFGVPVGSFQAIKHHLSNALLQAEFAKPVVLRAAASMRDGEPTTKRDVSMAKAYASDAATFVARTALQCHGAIGYTVEHDLHLWMKRSWSLASSWGDAAFHRERVATSILGRPQAY